MSRSKSTLVANRSTISATSTAGTRRNPNRSAAALPVKRRFVPAEAWGLLLLACALLFNAYYVAPELRIGRVPLNDAVFHVAASERLLTGVGAGRAFARPVGERVGAGLSGVAELSAGSASVCRAVPAHLPAGWVVGRRSLPRLCIC